MQVQKTVCSQATIIAIHNTNRLPACDTESGDPSCMHDGTLRVLKEMLCGIAMYNAINKGLPGVGQCLHV